MALTAARTELDIALVGQDETQRMLEEAKAKMAALEGQTKSLTTATKAQTAAAKESQGTLGEINGKMKGLAERAEGVVGGVDKIKGAFDKVVGVFGFAGMAVSGLVDGINFLVDAFDDSAEKAAEHERQLAETKRKTDALKESTDALTSALVSFQAVTRGAGAALASQRAALLVEQGKNEEAAKATREAAVEQTKQSLAGLEEAQKNASKQVEKALGAELVAIEKVKDAERKLGELREKKRLAEEGAKTGILTRHRDAAAARARELHAEMRAQEATVATEKAQAKLATQAKLEGEKAVELLGAQVSLERELLAARKANIETGPPKDEPKPTAARGGGGGGAADRKKEQQDAAKKAAEEAEALRVKAEQDAAFAAKNAETMMRVNAALRDELRQSIDLLRQQIETSLAAVPAGAQYADTREKLKAQLKAANEQMEIFNGLIHISDPDVMTSAIDKQTEAVDKLASSLESVTAAQRKIQEESEKTRRELERSMPADTFAKFTAPLEQLGAIAAPAFEEVTRAVAGVTAQLAKFKDGQQTLAQSLIGSGGAIAGVIAKNVGGVKQEAGVRAAFETAMGFATLFTNPAASVGHFTAAAMFGGIATGLIKPAGSGGGQTTKDTRPAASTRESSLGGGGGGMVTNVYNLQTGIIDGQSTAIAFRRAEQQARNTGMASAGGW